jgi:hypothetical protein
MATVELDESSYQQVQPPAEERSSPAALQEAAPALPPRDPLRPHLGWLVPIIAIGTVFAWTAVFFAVFAGSIAAADARELVSLFSAWVVPVLFIGMAWLLVRGGSAGEARRFNRAASSLRVESMLLETRLTRVNRELSLARQFIEAQGRDLESLGRAATERLGESGSQLRDLVQVSADQIETIANVSSVALQNMEALREQLPVLASSTKDVTNYIGSAGRNAEEHVGALQTALQRLGDAGLASEQQVRSMRAAVDVAVGEFAQQCEQLGVIAEVRFAALADRGESFRGQLDAHEAEALAAIRNRAGALSDELERLSTRIDADERSKIETLQQRANALSEASELLALRLREGEEAALERWRGSVARIESTVGGAFALIENADRDVSEASRRRLLALSDEIERIDAALEERESSLSAQITSRRAATAADQQQALAELDQRFEQFDASVAARRTAHERHAAALVEHSESMVARLTQFEERIAEIAAHSGQVGARLTEELQALTEGLDRSRSTLAATNGEVVALTDASALLLERLQATSAHGRDDLPAAIQQGASRFAELADENARLLATLTDAQRQGESLAALLQQSGGQLLANFGEIALLQTRASDKAGFHGEQLEALLETLGAMDETSDRVLAKARGEFAETLSQLARQLGEASSTALDRALRAGTAETAGKLEQAAAHAVGVSSEAAMQLRGEIGRVDELVSGLEARIAEARNRAETQIDIDFARRAESITDSLNANAVDIARALDQDVPDSAWTAYLKGNRGLFARRAVSLLDRADSRAVATLYERDADFRANVTRYITDFEAMLRDLLGSREGHTFAVTLLSSDLGRLYVALAQGIERLRR